ncbi:MAG: hypothetical protein KGZ35_03705 [Truepera sp.]|nr:hypothetical protein [Truepera sp.]
MLHDPLVAILLLLFLLLIAVLLTLWLALTSTTRTRQREAISNPDPVSPKLALSNDQVRGAKATKPPDSKQEDAFEQFLKAKNDDLDF